MLNKENNIKDLSLAEEMNIRVANQRKFNALPYVQEQ